MTHTFLLQDPVQLCHALHQLPGINPGRMSSFYTYSLVTRADIQTRGSILTWIVILSVNDADKMQNNFYIIKNKFTLNQQNLFYCINNVGQQF